MAIRIGGEGGTKGGVMKGESGREGGGERLRKRGIWRKRRGAASRQLVRNKSWTCFF